MIPCTFSGNGSSAVAACVSATQPRELLCVERIPACAREQRRLQIGRKHGSVEQAVQAACAVSSSESGETDNVTAFGFPPPQPGRRSRSSGRVTHTTSSGTPVAQSTSGRRSRAGRRRPSAGPRRRARAGRCSASASKNCRQAAKRSARLSPPTSPSATMPDQRAQALQRPVPSRLRPGPRRRPRPAFARPPPAYRSRRSRPVPSPSRRGPSTSRRRRRGGSGPAASR